MPLARALRVYRAAARGAAPQIEHMIRRTPDSMLRLALAAAMLASFCARAADNIPASELARGSTSSSTLHLIDSEAMNRMLRADRDKNGTLSREELEQYDAALSKRFREVDVDRDGKLTLYEFEKLITPAGVAEQ
jgi:hypothetical protein